MNIPFLIAGSLTTLAALAHSIGGEMTTIRSLASAELKEVPKLELRAGWYMIAAHLFASAIMLFILAFNANGDIVMGRFLAIQFFGYGLAFLGLAIVRPVGLLQAPQWVLFFLMAGLTYWGTI